MRFPTYRAFWPYYVSEHRSALNRRLHFVGTGLALALLFFSVVLAEPWLLIAVPVAGYGFAWAGHYFVEKNRPVTFQHPFYSLLGDLHMFALMCLGRMHREVRRMAVLTA